MTVFSLTHPASERFACQPGFIPLGCMAWEMLGLQHVY